MEKECILTSTRIWTLAVVAIVILFVYLTKGVLLPFLAGLAIAYFLDPVADVLEARKVPRGIAAALVISLFFVLLIGIMIAMWPIFQNQIAGAVDMLPKSIAGLKPWLVETMAKFSKSTGVEITTDIDTLLAEYSNTLLGYAQNTATGVLKGSLAIFNILTLIIISPVVAFYLLRDWDHLVAKVDSWLPPENGPVIRAQAKQVDSVLAGFVRGQLLVSVAMGTLYAIGWTLVGLDFGLMLGVLAGVMAFVPFVGALFAVVIALAMGVGQWGLDAYHLGLVASVFGVVQIVESAFLTPKLLGERVGLHPVWVLFAVFAGGEVMGFVGVLIAVPAAAVIAVLVRFVIDMYLDHHDLKDILKNTDEPVVQSGDKPETQSAE